MEGRGDRHNGAELKNLPIPFHGELYLAALLMVAAIQLHMLFQQPQQLQH
jgi:hypothetical protein